MGAGPSQAGIEAAPGDCRSNEGIMVALIDGIIAQSRVVNRLRVNLKHQPGANKALSEALADLRSDEDVRDLLGEPLVVARIRAGLADEIDNAGHFWCQDYGRCSHRDCLQRKGISDSVRGGS